MIKKNTNPWLVAGVVVAVLLLVWWLFAGSILEEDGSNEITPMSIEQVN